MIPSKNIFCLVICIISFSSILMPASLFAQTSKSLSLEEAIQLGLDNSKNLKVSSSKVQLIENKIEQMRNSYVPNVNLNVQYNRLSNNIEPFVVSLGPGVTKTLNPQILNQFSNRASLSYSLFNGFRLRNSFENIKFLENAVNFDYEKDVKEIKYNIISAYCSYLKIIQSKLYVEKSIEQANIRLKEISNLQKNGMALEVDVMKTELNKSNFEMNLEEVNAALEISNYNMDLLLGLPTNTKLILTSSFSEKAKVDDVNSLVQTALTKRLELQALDNRQKASEVSIKIVKGNVYPVFSVGGNLYYNNPNQRVFPNEEKFKGTWDAGAMLTWSPSSLYTNKAAVQEAKLNATQLQFSKDILKDGIQTEVFSNYQNYKLALQKIELATKSSAYANENVNILKNKVDNNINVIADLNDADVMKLQSEINIVNAKLDAVLAYQKLLKSIGE